jgi:hypothetical protein
MKTAGRICAQGALLTLALGGFATAARADFEMHYPIIDYREIELEHNGSTRFDKANSGKSNNQSYTSELGYGVTPWWEPELEGEWDAPPGQNSAFTFTTLENTFQLTDQGEYWADLGFFAEYQHAASRAGTDQFNFGPLVQKEWDVFGLNTLHTANFLVSKQVGRNRNDATPYAVSWQSRIQINQYVQPGIEYYGSFNTIADRNTLSDPTHRIGPVLVGSYNLYGYGKLKYEAGYLFGLNNATEAGTLRWRLEYEKSF